MEEELMTPETGYEDALQQELQDENGETYEWLFEWQHDSVPAYPQSHNARDH